MAVARSTVAKFLHYASAGVIAFGFDYSSFLILYYSLHQPIVVANSISFLMGLTVSFLLHRFWVFRPKDRSTAKLFAMYATLGLFNLVLTNIVLVGLKHVGVPPALGKLFVQFLVVMWNFVILRNYVFVHKKVEV